MIIWYHWLNGLHEMVKDREAWHSTVHGVTKSWTWLRDWTSGTHNLFPFFTQGYNCPYSIQFSCSVMSDSLWPHGLQHARPPCPSPSPRPYSNSCPLSLWCHPTTSFSVVWPLLLQPSTSPSIRVFSNESALRIRWPKNCSFSFRISPSNQRSGLISFRMDWWDLLAVQGTLKSLLQHHSSKASILWYSAFFIVQLSHPYRTTGKTIALAWQIFVGKVMSLLFNMLSSLVVTFLPRSKHLFISQAILAKLNQFCGVNQWISTRFPLPQFFLFHEWWSDSISSSGDWQ